MGNWFPDVSKVFLKRFKCLKMFVKCSNDIIWYDIIWYHIISYDIISYHIISYHTISYNFMISQVMDFFDIFDLCQNWSGIKKSTIILLKKVPKNYSRVETLSFLEYFFWPLKKHQISFKIGQNGSPESENFFPGVFWHGVFSFNTPG